MQFYSNIRRLYVISFFHNLIPAYVIERLFWQSRGMTIPMVVYCEIIYAVTVIVLEIPSGVLADRMGRKSLILAGCILSCLEISVLLFARSFWYFALAVTLGGIGTACISGAWNALLYDSLAACGRQGEFEACLGRIRAADYAAGLIACLAGGVLARYLGYDFNYRISLVSVLLAVVFALSLREPSRWGRQEQRQRFGDVLIAAMGFFRSHPGVMAVVVHGVMIAAFIIYIDEFWQLYLSGIDFPVAFFGVVSALLLIARTPGALAASWLMGRVSLRTLLVGLSFITAASFAALSVIRGPVGIAVMGAAYMASEVMEVIVTGYLHRQADDDARATIDSMSSLMEKGGSIVLGLLFAWAAGRLSIFAGYLVLGAVCTALSFVMWRLYRKKGWP